MTSFKKRQEKYEDYRDRALCAERRLAKLHRLTGDWADGEMAQLQQEVQACREHADAVDEENDRLKMQVVDLEGTLAALKDELGAEQALRAKVEGKYRRALGDFKDLDSLLEVVQLSAQRARLLDEANAKIEQLAAEHLAELNRAEQLLVDADDRRTNAIATEREAHQKTCKKLEDAHAKITKLEGYLEEELAKRAQPSAPPKPQAVKTKRGAKGPTRKEQVLALLRQRPHSRAELAEAMETSPGNVSQTLRGLKKDGLAQSGGGVWSLTSKPESESPTPPKAEALPARVISHPQSTKMRNELEEEILAHLRKGPATTKSLTSSLEVASGVVWPVLEDLVDEGIVFNARGVFGLEAIEEHQLGNDELALLRHLQTLDAPTSIFQASQPAQLSSYKIASNAMHRLEVLGLAKQVDGKWTATDRGA